MRRILFSAFTALMLSGCFAHEADNRDRQREGGARDSQRQNDYRDNQGNPYRHERWQNEDVYRREDGHWYSRRNNDWIMRAEINIQ